MVNTISRCVRANTLPPNAGAAFGCIVSDGGNAVKKVMPDRSNDGNSYLLRTMENVGANDLYFSIDYDKPSAADNHGLLSKGQSISIPTYGAVYVFSTQAWQVAIIEIVDTQMS